MATVGYAHLCEALDLKAIAPRRVAMIKPVTRITLIGNCLAVPAAVAPAPAFTVHPSVGKFVVLVAEDDPINSKIIKKRLERMGHDVVLTTNGKECFEEFGLRAKRYDAVLMDMQVRKGLRGKICSY